MTVSLSERKMLALLDSLCVKIGFCLSPSVKFEIVKFPPATVDEFTDMVYRAEGLDPNLQSGLYNQVWTMVAENFKEHNEPYSQ